MIMILIDRHENKTVFDDLLSEGTLASNLCVQILSEIFMTMLNGLVVIEFYRESRHLVHSRL